jgi:hypothetical protein
MLKTDTIKMFLDSKTHKDLAELYNPDMEVQVNVAQDNGERVDQAFKGKDFQTYTNGDYEWKTFRIPFNASTNPEYTDSDIKFPIETHAQGIGLTGWDWKNRVSKWVAYDFDDMVGHADGLSVEELESIKKSVSDVEWVTLRTSTSGRGLHLYVFLDDVVTKNHTEHAALARWILSQLSGLVGYNLLDKVDVCGQIMWFWHRKLNTEEGLLLTKKGSIFTDIDSSWRDNIPVIKKQSTRVLPAQVQGNKDFQEAIGQGMRVPLDDEHKKLISFLSDAGYKWAWDTDNNLLTTHTWYLKEAHMSLNLSGVFETISTGADAPSDHNCFCFPMRKGSWSVRRFSIGTKEHTSWQQDSNGWTKCLFNSPCTFDVACRFNEGVEHPSGAFVFRHVDLAIASAALLGVEISVPNFLRGRATKLKIIKNKKLVIEVTREPTDPGDNLQKWVAEGKTWKRVFQVQREAAHDTDSPTFEDIIRHVLDEIHNDQGWLLKSNGSWASEPIGNVRLALQANGLKSEEIGKILGGSVLSPWVLVSRPFEDEYIGDRQWNRNAAQIRFSPTEDLENLQFPTWQSILDHCGKTLTNDIRNHPWCKLNGIKSGADYLHVWLASLLQYPGEPLPYLFLYGEQNSGKSTLHEAIGLLMTKGVRRADNALGATQFNGEIQGAVLCVIEETDLNKSKEAYNKVKDWVTGSTITIHEKGRTPIDQRNYTHWIQVSNEAEACPIFPGDTRITTMLVEDLDLIKMIPRRRLFGKLEKEAPDFLASLLNLTIPECNDRLRIPIIDTLDKSIMQSKNQEPLEEFISTFCHYVPGSTITFQEFYGRFIEWVDESESHMWSNIRVSKKLPINHRSGKDLEDGGKTKLINISWDPSTEPSELLTLINKGSYLAISKA